MRRGLPVFVFAALVLALAAFAARPLPSWNEGPSRQAILQFVGRTTTTGSPDFVAPADRIAVFDNDGTLWAEQPMYFQLLFALDRVKALAPQHPEWRALEPFASVLEGDLTGALAGGERAMAQLAMQPMRGQPLRSLRRSSATGSSPRSTRKRDAC